MNRFGLPLLPAGLAIWVVDFADRLFLGRIVDQHEVGLYAVGVKIASAMVLVQLAFRTAWPAFAYSLEEGPEARRTFAYVLTYTSLLGCWMSLGLGLLAPWLVDWLAAPEFASAERVVAPLAFAGALLVAYTTLSIAASRANQTQRYWQVAVVGAAVNVGLNLLLIPTYGMEGAAAATVAAYLVLAGGMAWLAQRLYPVPYEWRRLAIAVGVGVVLYAAGRLADAPLAGAVAAGPRLSRRAGAAGLLPAGRAASPRDPGGENTPTMTLDLHAHVLAGVDDGPDTIEEALELLRALQDEGVTSVAATPHVHPAYPTTVQTRDERLAQVQEAAAAAGLTIVVVPGGELDLEYACVVRRRPDPRVGARRRPGGAGRVPVGADLAAGAGADLPRPAAARVPADRGAPGARASRPAAAGAPRRRDRERRRLPDHERLARRPLRRDARSAPRSASSASAAAT